MQHFTNQAIKWLLRIQIHYNIWLESFTSTDPSREWMKGFHFRMANLLYFRQDIYIFCKFD